MPELIPYEPSLRILSLTLNPVEEQVVHRIESTGGRKVITLSPSYFTGAVSFGARADRMAIARAEAFFTSLRGQENYFDLPLQNIKPTGGAGGSVVSVGENNKIEVNFSTEIGFYWHSKGRLFIHVSREGSMMELLPNIPWAAGDIIQPASFIRVRPSGAVNLPITPHWGGGWTLQFEELI